MGREETIPFRTYILSSWEEGDALRRSPTERCEGSEGGRKKKGEGKAGPFPPRTEMKGGKRRERLRLTPSQFLFKGVDSLGDVCPGEKEVARCGGEDRLGLFSVLSLQGGKEIPFQWGKESGRETRLLEEGPPYREEGNDSPKKGEKGRGFAIERNNNN